MTYDEFEMVAFDNHVPYVLSKIMWENFPGREEPYQPKRLAHMFTVVMNEMKNHPQTLEAMRFLSDFEIAPGVLEEIGRKMGQDKK